MKCPRCGHDGEMHNDAGSAPIGFYADVAYISEGIMCCYANPSEGQSGRENWTSRVCGCSHLAPGSKRYY